MPGRVEGSTSAPTACSANGPRMTVSAPSRAGASFAKLRISMTQVASPRH